MSSIRLVLFDMDDVVYDYTRAHRVAYLAEVTGFDPAVIDHRIWGEGLESAADGGAYPTPELYIASWRDRLGYPLSVADWVEARRRAMRPIAGTLKLIERLKARGLAIAVLTNNGPLVHLHRWTLAPDLARLAEQRFLVSSAFSTLKPDPEVFRRALDRLGFAPAETFFIDDMPENVAGAREAELSGTVFTDPGRLEAGFVDAGLLPCHRETTIRAESRTIAIEIAG